MIDLTRRLHAANVSNSASTTNTKALVRNILKAIEWLFIFPGDWVSDRFGVEQGENRGLVRMLVNSLFGILVVTIGLTIWTNTLPIYQ